MKFPLELRLPTKNEVGHTAKTAVLAGLVCWQAALTTRDVQESSKNYIPVSNPVSELGGVRPYVMPKNCDIGVDTTVDDLNPATLPGGAISGFVATGVGAAYCGTEFFKKN